MEKNSLNPIKVSVCVSFYNAEKFVQRCLDMLCAQSMKEGLEIVLVNDGSKDSTDELMRNYAANHPERTFVLVTQENGSLCQGRLTGIRNSSGEYITFLDQDDLIDTTAYEKMYGCAKEYDADIVEIQTKNGDRILRSPFEGLQKSHEILKYYFTNGGVQSMLWMRMYRRELFEKPILPSIRTNNEDMYGYPCLLHAARSIYFLQEQLHTYSIDNEGSYMARMSNPAMAEKRFQSRKLALGSFEHFKNFVGENGMQEYKDEFQTYMATYCFGFLMTMFVNKTMQNKIDAIIEKTAMNSRKDIETLLRKRLPHKSMTNYIYRIFGLKAAYSFCKFKNHA